MGDPAENTRTLSDDDFTAPIDDRFFEDYKEGAVYEYGHITVSEAEILEFARAFDPQPIHVDPEFAAQGPFRGLIASGWHTGAIMMRLFADHYLSRVASLASPGIDELRWPAPLRPGDSVKMRVTTVETRRSRSKPDRGLVRSHVELITQNEETVLTLTAMNLLRARDAGGGSAP
jgi:acyl dehydratase